MKRRGIIIAGGSGTRLKPLTDVVSKQLLPVYDKPMIYYPLCTLMQANIQEILIITAQGMKLQYSNLLSDGSQWGINISYTEQPRPEGIAQALILAEDFLDGHPAALILGDNIFYGGNIRYLLKTVDDRSSGATIFSYHVNDPQRYGIVELDGENSDKVLSIEEKPKFPKSQLAVTGLYFYDEKAVEYAKRLKPSDRGELEITDLNKLYLETDDLYCIVFEQGCAWLDMGTFDSLLDAAHFVKTIQHRQGLIIASPEQTAIECGFV